MNRNSFWHHKVLTYILMVALLCMGVYLYVSAHDTEDSDNYNTFTLRHSVRGDVRDEIVQASIPLNQLVQIRDGIQKELRKSGSNSRQNVRSALVSAVSGSPGGVVNAFLNQLSETMTGNQLVAALAAANTSIDNYITTHIDVAIFQRPNTGYNAAYDRLVAAYNDLNDYYRREANFSLFGEWDFKKRTIPKTPVPDANSVSVVPCAVPKGKCYSYDLKADAHKHICMHKHGPSGETNVEYWICQNDVCHRRWEHWKPCRAEGCNVLFPPPTLSSGYAPGLIYHDHEKICTEPLHHWLFGSRPCGKKYFTCEGGCNHRNRDGVYWDKTEFGVYETLSVKIVHKNIIYASMYLKGPGDVNNVGRYADSNCFTEGSDTIVLREDLSSGYVAGTYTVTIFISIMDGESERTVTYNRNISITH